MIIILMDGHTCNFVAQLLSRDRVAVCNCECRKLPLCRIYRNDHADWLVLVYVAKLQCATWDTKLYDKIAGVTLV